MKSIAYDDSVSEVEERRFAVVFFSLWTCSVMVTIVLVTSSRQGQGKGSVYF